MPYRPEIQWRSIIADAERASRRRTNTISQGDCSFADRAFSIPSADFRARTRFAPRWDMLHTGWLDTRDRSSRMKALAEATKFIPAGLRRFIAYATVLWYLT